MDSFFVLEIDCLKTSLHAKLEPEVFMTKILRERTHLDTKREQELKNTNKGRATQRSQGGKRRRKK